MGYGCGGGHLASGLSCVTCWLYDLGLPGHCLPLYPKFSHLKTGIIIVLHGYNIEARPQPLQAGLSGMVNVYRSRQILH